VITWDDLTLFVSPYNNVMGRLGGFGAENHQKHDFNDFFYQFWSQMSDQGGPWGNYMGS
jgi:hypothetical protein